MPAYQEMYGCDHNGHLVSCKHVYSAFSFPVHKIARTYDEESGSYFSVIVTVPGGVSVSSFLEDVFDKGRFQERIEETIGHNIFPANRSLCSPSLIKQVKWSGSEGAGDQSSSIIGAVMGVLVLVMSAAAIGYIKQKRTVFPENSSAEIQMEEEN
ncbi:uncharacterized protein [Haliotis asinina]|uniref:uncharacterized protein n=1 Tax=Haliotis asinina TaxID=109174 RepID=UPI003531E691